MEAIMSKRKLSENFEEIYLRYGTAEKYLHKVSSEEVQLIKNQKIITYMTNKYYMINKSLLLSIGYNFDDLRNIVAVYAATFLGSDAEADSERGKNLIMMRYIDQRMDRFVKWASKKFGVGEVVSYTSLIEDYKYEYSDTLNNVIEIDGVPMWGKETPISIREQIINIDLELEDLSCSGPNPEREKVLRKERQDLKKKYNKENGKNRNLIKKLRAELNENWEDHKDTLAFYATSKHVAEDMRRAARKYCRKFDINYIELTLKLIKKNNYENKDFTLNE